MMRKELKLRNKFIMAPVKTGYGNPDGGVTAEHITWYKRLNKDLGAIIIEPPYIDKRLRELPTQIGIDDDNKIWGLSKLVDSIHEGGAKAIAQINHPGRLTNPKILGNICVSASPVACPSYKVVPQELTIPDIKDIINLYVQAAIRAEKANFDAIELQFGHGYLIAQFLSEHINTRTDEYGGSLSDRVNFGIEILDKILSRVNLPVIVRLSASEEINNGWSMTDTIKLLDILDTRDIFAYHVSTGSLCESPEWYYQHMLVQKGKSWDYAKQIKERFTKPVIAVGQITTFDDIDKIIDGNYADYIALGRTLVADTEFIAKYNEKREGDVNHCLGCLDGCLFSIKKGKGLQCVVNPEIRKDYVPLELAKNVKKIAVVGAGIAGMKSAVMLREKGHEVTLYDKIGSGGQFNLAHLPPQKGGMESIIDDLSKQVRDILVIKEVKADDLMDYDEVVLATGSTPIKAPFPCDMEYMWAEVLQGEFLRNRSVIIVGGGLIGIEIAAWLSEFENEIFIVEMLDDIAKDMNPISKKMTMQELKNVDILTGSRVTKVENGILYYEKDNEQHTIDNFNDLIITIGMKSNNKLAAQLEGKVKYHLIGDAAKVGNALTATHSAYDLVKQI